MNMKQALIVSADYPNTRGYELGFREKGNRLTLSDGVVSVDVTEYTEAQLREEIEDWIASSEFSGLDPESEKND